MANNVNIMPFPVPTINTPSIVSISYTKPGTPKTLELASYFSQDVVICSKCYWGESPRNKEHSKVQ